MGRTTWEESFQKAAKNKTEWDRLGTLANTAKGSAVLLSGRSEVRVLSGVTKKEKQPYWTFEAER